MTKVVAGESDAKRQGADRRDGQARILQDRFGSSFALDLRENAPQLLGSRSGRLVLPRLLELIECHRGSFFNFSANSCRARVSLAPTFDSLIPRISEMSR